MTPDQQKTDGDGSPPPSAGERLKLDPYSGPRSHHASRAFANMIAVREARAHHKKRSVKFGLVFFGLVLGSALALVAFRWFFSD